jgi:phage shock protein PspC (stress-responsive transcriptional regulator)
MVAGVAGGIARRLGIEPWVIRTAFVALTVAGGGGIALYLLGWIAIRDEAESRSHAQRWFGSTGGDRRPDAQEA